MRGILLLLSLLFSVIVCDGQTATPDTVKEVDLDTLTVSVPGGARPYRCAEPRLWNIVHTRIALSFNLQEKTAGVQEWIKLHPYCYDTDSLILDAKNMRIDSVLLTGQKKNNPLRYTYDNNQLKIYFGCFYHATDTVNLYFRYTAMPYSNLVSGSTAIAEDRGLYFINTDFRQPGKPVQIWTQGETESNSNWMITIDKPNTRFTTQVELTVPDSFTTLSNGVLKKQLKQTGNTRTDIWNMSMPVSAYTVMFAMGKYTITKDRWRNKEVRYYTEPAFTPYAKKMFNNTVEMLEYFSQRTGVPYPWPAYSQVVVRDYITGAMENTSASVFGEFMNQNAREIADRNYEDIVAHELFHQWFGDYVTAESWSNLTVNESFANYGEQLWRTYKYGQASGDELAYNDLQSYIRMARVNDPQLVRFYYDSREEMFDHVSYNKGGTILRYLHSLTGDKAFDRAMNLYLVKNAHHTAEAHNWRMAVEEATGTDWNWFFNEWYYRAGHPVVRIVYNYNDSLKVLGVSVQQVDNDNHSLYHMPLKTAVIYGAEKNLEDWHITKRKDTFTYAYKNGVRPVIIPDYTHIVPGEVWDEKEPPQWRAQFLQTDDYINKRLAVAAAGKELADSNSQKIIDTALSDLLPAIRRLALSQIKNTVAENYHKRWTTKIVTLALTDSNTLVRADAFGVLGAWKVTSLKPQMINTLHDSSYTLAGNALDAINRMDKDTAYLLAKQLLPTDPKSTLESVIWNIIGAKGHDSDISLYEVRAPYMQGAKKITFAGSLQIYLEQVKSSASFAKGLRIFTALIINDNLKNYRNALISLLSEVADELKEHAAADKKDDEIAAAKEKLELVKTVFQSILTTESDPDITKDLKKKLKEISE